MSEKQKVLQLINRITYGPNPETIAYVEQVGIDKFVEEQLHPKNITEPASLTDKLAKLETLDMSLSELLDKYGPSSGDDKMARREMRKKAGIIITELSQAKLERGVESKAQLQELLTDFWYNHFNVFAEKAPCFLMVSDYERNAIRPHTLGHFREILEATAKHPAMLFYLDNWLNTDPKSPAARNKQSGINENYAREIMELHTMGVDGGYSQNDVTTLARILTGWGVSKGKEWSDKGEFYFDRKRHDFSDKIFLGHHIKGSGEYEIEEALDILASHPSTAHHISYQLAQYFLADTPPESIVSKMAETFSKTDGDISEVLRTMFKAPEFWDTKYYRVKFKSPLRYVISTLRVTGINDDKLILIPALKNMGEHLYHYQTPDGFANTNDHWLNSDALLKRIDIAKVFAKAGENNDQNLNATALMNILGNDLSPATQQAVKQAEPKLQPVLILSSPEFLYY